MAKMTPRTLIVLMLLAGLALGPVAAEEPAAQPTEAPAGGAVAAEEPAVQSTEEPAGGDAVAETADAAAPWSPAPQRELTQEEFPFPPHDPRPLMQALIKRKQPTDTTPFTFVAVSDWHGRRGVDLFGLLQRLNPDFALTMGDLVNNGIGPGGLAEYRNLERAAGEFFRKYPTWSAPGNHEVGKGGAGGKPAEQQAEARRRFSAYFGQPHDDLFSFTYANAKFIGLPFEFYESDDRLKKLEAELASAEGKHIFVFSHHAYYTGLWRRQNAVREAAAELFKKHKVVAVLGGGTHLYYRQRKDGVNYILNGTGGMLGPIQANRNHPTLRNTLPGDAWYGRNPDDGSKSHFVRPDLEEPIRVEGQRNFAVLISVEGPRVTLRLVDIDGKEWDRSTLAGPATEEAAPATR